MASSAATAADAIDTVHMLWVGDGVMPDFAFRCIASYAALGHLVHLWLYPQQFPSDGEEPSPLPEGVHRRDANEIIPFATALDIGYYHGMGPQLRFSSWSTFADLFRYELLFREGGWWCDADSVAVQRLDTYGFPPQAHIFATEAWRPVGYRNIILAVPRPGSPGAASSSRPPVEYISGDFSREEGKAWRDARAEEPVHCSVLTNSHIRAPAGSALMRACADELRPLMEAYAVQCREHALGDESVEWALPTGGEGLRIFQEQIANRITAGDLEAEEYLAGVQHYAVFNPAEIDDFPGGMRVLKGERPVPHATCTMHCFGMMRDSWKTMRLEVPDPFNIVRDPDNDQLLTSIKQVEAAKMRAERLQKRRQRDLQLGDVKEEGKTVERRLVS